MIPTVLLIAVFGTILFPRHGGWVVTLSSAAWILIVLVEGSAASTADFLGSVALGTMNAVAGFGLGWVFRNTVGPVAHL